MTNEQLAIGNTIQEQISKLEHSRNAAKQRMSFSDFPDMDYQYYQAVAKMALNFYDNKINELQKQFAEL